MTDIIRTYPCEECVSASEDGCQLHDGPCDDYRMAEDIGKLAVETAKGITKIRHMKWEQRGELAGECFDALDNAMWEVGPELGTACLDRSEFNRLAKVRVEDRP